MCFSATASFTAAAGLTLVGAATLRLRPPGRTLPFAIVPLLFAVHQAIEGFIWLSVNDAGAAPPTLINAWVFIAKSFWPVWTPFMVLMLEEERRRRIGLFALLVAGAVASAVLLYVQVTHPFSVEIVNGSLQYASHHPLSDGLVGLYVLATIAPLLLSHFRYVELFGVAILVGSVVTEIFYQYAGPSVWCFFAAISSALVYLHVREQTRGGQSDGRPIILPKSE